MRTARRLGRPWCVHQADRTGFAGDDPDASPEGLPALALALLDLIRGEFWMALVEGDAETGDRARGNTLESDPGTGDSDADGTGRYALVKARGGTVLADGDEVFETRAAALAAFERARALGWALHATPGLVAGLPGSGIAALDIAALDEAASRAGRQSGRRRPGKRDRAVDGRSFRRSGSRSWPASPGRGSSGTGCWRGSRDPRPWKRRRSIPSRSFPPRSTARR